MRLEAGRPSAEAGVSWWRLDAPLAWTALSDLMDLIGETRMQAVMRLKSVCMIPGQAWRGMAGMAYRWRCWLLLRLSLRSLVFVATGIWCVRSLMNTRVRWNGILRYESGCESVGLSKADALRTMSGGIREMLIDQRLHLGRHARLHEHWPDLSEVALKLAHSIEKLRRDEPGRPVILAPFHYVSQYANIYVIDKVREALGLASIVVVSGVPRDQYGDDAMIIPGVRVLYTYDSENRAGLGLRVFQAMKRDGVVVLFADVPPYTLHKYPMETVGVSILGRPGRIHNGVFRLGVRADAVLLPFYLRCARGRLDAQAFDAIALAEADAPQKVARCISRALTDNYPDWIMAGDPSMYAFAPQK